MSKWQTRIEGHAVHLKIKSLVDALIEVKIPSDSPDVIFDLERISQVAKLVSQQISAVDPLLLTPQILNNLETPINNIIAEINNFKANNNKNHLVTANTHVDTLLQNLYIVPKTYDANDAMVIKSSIESLYGNSSKYLADIKEASGSVNKSIADASQRLETLVSEINAQKGRLDKAISDYQAQFSQSESTRSQQFVEAQNQRVQKVEAALAEQQKKLDMAIETSNKRLLEQSQLSETKIAGQLSQLKESGTSLLNTLTEFKDKAQNLMHVIGSTGMSGEYQKVADTSRKASYVWQGIAGVSMLGLILFAIAAFQSTQVSTTETIRWGAVATRVFVAMAFGVLGAYAARQGDRYIDSEARNRRYQLELSSIDPYLANLPDNIKTNVKVQLADKLFGNAGSHTLGQSDKKQEVSANAIDVLKATMQLMHDLVAKIK